MADDFRDDPQYKQAKGSMFGSSVKSMLWGAGAALLTIASLGSGSAFGIIAYGAAALFSGYKAWSAHKDEEAAMSEITAQRTAHHVMRQTAAMQQDQAFETDAPGDSRWQRTEAARRAAAAAQAQSAQAQR
jgi:hypothetical protein